MNNQRDHGFSLLGLVVSMGIMVVLASILMTSLSNSVGPGVSGGVQQNQANTFADRLTLDAIFKGMYALEMSGGNFPTPTSIGHSNDKSLNTTANLFSSLIARGAVGSPSQLISKNEQSDFVWEDEDYNRNSYRPVEGIYWDTNFVADLTKLSNTSYAHMPLLGERFRLGWVKGGASYLPIIGNRGPKDGVPSQNSYACTANGSWGGNIVFADGHQEFTTNPIGSTTYGTDNYFKLESGFDGEDAILTFTKAIWEDGFEMQFD